MNSSESTVANGVNVWDGQIKNAATTGTGIGEQRDYGPGSTARGCLLAVRLVERGVRMVQVYYAKGDPWDAHTDIQQHRKCAKDSDQPFAAVIAAGVRVA